MSDDRLDQLLRDLRAEQIPSRPQTPSTAEREQQATYAALAPRTAEQQAAARAILERETVAYDRANRTDQYGHRPRLKAAG